MELTFCHRNTPDVELEVVGTKSRWSELEAFLNGNHLAVDISILGIPATRDVKSHATVTKATFLVLLGKILGHLISIND